MLTVVTHIGRIALRFQYLVKTNRGFDTFYGYLQGEQQYYNHTVDLGGEWAHG